MIAGILHNGHSPMDRTQSARVVSDTFGSYISDTDTFNTNYPSTGPLAAFNGATYNGRREKKRRKGELGRGKGTGSGIGREGKVATFQLGTLDSAVEEGRKGEWQG